MAFLRVCRQCEKQFSSTCREGRFCAQRCESSWRTWRAIQPWRIEQRFFEKVDKAGPVARPGLTPCWMWRGLVRSNGYGASSIGPRKLQAHRLSFFIHHGRWPEHEVCHRCDVPLCVNPDHLFEGTHAENMADMCTKGRARPGGKLRHCGALTESQARSLIERRNAGATYAALAAEFGISVSAAGHVVTGYSWARLERPWLSKENRK